ncbi:MAG: orotate phosphoribosyltransferase [Desulfotomaculales bacterium]
MERDSGRILAPQEDAAKKALHKLVSERAFETGEFTLSSGRKSNYYFDGKQVTLHPEGAYLLARMIVDKVKKENINALGGPTIGADPIVGAVAAVAHLEGLRDLKLFIVRKEPKKHGKRRWIEGPELAAGDRVAVVEDVITTGASVLRAVDRLKEIGCQVVKVIVLVDRMEGGSEALRERGIPVDAFFTIKDFGNVTP